MNFRFVTIKGGARTGMILPTPKPGPSTETLMLNTTSGGASSGIVLASGAPYTVTVQGTWSDWNDTLNGKPEPDAMFPTTNTARKTTQVGLDPDVEFARPSYGTGTPPQHWTQLQFSLDGSTWAHVEPVGGPYSIPQPQHLYTYHLTGRGHPLGIRIADSPLTNNYGALRIVISPGGAA